MAITGLTLLASGNSGGSTVSSQATGIVGGSGVAVGSTVVVVARCGGGFTFGTGGCFDSSGNTYTRHSTTTNGTGSNVAIFSAPITSAISALGTFTVTPSSSSSHVDLAAYLIAGSVNWKNHFDQQASNQNASPATGLLVPSAGSTATLWRPGDIVIGVLGVGATVTNPAASGYTLANSVDWMHAFYKIVTSTAGVSAVYTWTTLTNSAGAIAAFRAVDQAAMLNTFEG